MLNIMKLGNAHPLAHVNAATSCSIRNEESPVRNFCVVTIVALCGSSSMFAADPAGKEVEAAIQTLNDAFKTHDSSKIKALMTDDHTAVTPWGGKQNRDDQINSLPDLKLTEYDPSLMAVTMIGTDGALVTYSLKMKGTFKKKALPAHCLVSAVWIRKDGKWLELHYQETPMAGK